MLLRGANAVGYTSYPDNVVDEFIDLAAEWGVDVFRIFDSLNDLDTMKVAVDRVVKTGKVAEVAICYTGDVANPKRPKYSLDYYADLARRIEDMGSHFLCIKDMAGLLRPRAAGMLIDRLKETVKLPIHLLLRTWQPSTTSGSLRRLCSMHRVCISSSTAMPLKR